jgi:type I restriction enzyme S subunit
MSATKEYRKLQDTPITKITEFYIKKILDKVPYKALHFFIKRIKTGKTPPKSIQEYYDSEDIIWVKPSDIGYSPYISDSKEKFSNKAVEDNKATIYNPNTLLMIGIGGGVGRVVILKKKGSSNQQITGIEFKETIFIDYAYYYFLGKQDYVMSKTTKSSLPIINQKKIKELEIKVPSIEEQKEFVRYLKYCSNCFKNKTIPNNNDFNLDQSLLNFAVKIFKIQYADSKIKNNIKLQQADIKQLRQAILQEAIQGKLVPQNPNDERASVLLERIKAEKAELIKAKKIKKEKPLPSISEDEIPFELPESWVWCRLVDIAKYIQRGKSPKYSDLSDIPVVSQKCVQWSGFKIERVRFIDITTIEKYQEERFLQHHDMLWNSTGHGTLGRVCLFSTEKYNKIVADSHVTVVRMFKKYVNPLYLLYFYSSSIIQDIVLGKSIGSTKQTELGTGVIKKLTFPLPPLSEQKRIVEKVDKLMLMCERLEEQVKGSAKDAEVLMQAVLQEAFGS